MNKTPIDPREQELATIARKDHMAVPRRDCYLVLIQLANDHWWCPICDPYKRRLLPVRAHRICDQTQMDRLYESTAQGVGTEMKKLIGKFGIIPKGGCKCERRANLMNLNGIEWCERNAELIVDWLAEEAERRGFPFLRLAGRTLLRIAIRRAKKQWRLLERVKL